MSETKQPSDKPARKPLSLKRTVDAGVVRQNFSHGRSKSVEVVKKRRIVLPIEGGTAAPAKPKSAKPPASDKAAAKPAAKKTKPAAPEAKAPSNVLHSLSDEEHQARLAALAKAKERQAIEAELAKKQAEERAAKEKSEAATTAKEAKKAKSKTPVEAKEEAPAKSGTKPTAPASAEKSEPKATTAKAKTKSAPDDDLAPADTVPLSPAMAPRPGGKPKNLDPVRPKRAAAKPVVPPKEVLPEVAVPRIKRSPGGAASPSAKKHIPRTPPKSPPSERRVRGKLTVTNFNQEQRERSMASLRRKREREKQRAAGVPIVREKISREVTIPEVITIQELANRMAERAVDIIKLLMKQGEMHQVTDVIDTDTAELIVAEFGHTAKRISEADVEEGFISEEDAPETLQPRAPVVTIMGHVDHGKTSLLDAIREANVVSGEAGGITQHIGAYQVTTPDGKLVTFIDTPGHAAFTEMRARGANVTDIVVLVVAADDGVMPQTIEAINHAKAAEVPIIVAINKIDKPGIDPTRVRTELLQHEVIVESMSGETLEVEVSAIQKTNLDKLLEAISLQSELLDLTANPNRSAEGVVIEAQLERGRGPVGTLLVQRGTLAIGSIVVAGTSWGRVRALVDEHGKNVSKAGPSVPVEVLGFNSTPAAGDQFAVVESEARARELTEYRIRKRRDALGISGAGRTLEQMMEQLKEDGKKEFPLLVKGDVQGSIEAIAGALAKLGTDEVTAKIIHSGAGGITESDVALANASGSVIVGFNVRANQQAKAAAERDGIEIRYYNIIYDLVDDVKAAMSGLLAPTIKETFIGYAKILEVFSITKVGKVAGCQVTEGRVERGAGVRLLRDNVVIHEGKLSTLKRFKDEVKEVQTGQECGMAFEKYEDIRKDDQIECFTTEVIKRTLDD